MIPFEFRNELWYQKTRVKGLSCGVICVILRLAVLIQYRSVTDRHRTMSSDLVSRKSNDLSTHGPLCPAPSPYDSNVDSCDGNDSDGGGGHTSTQWTMSPDLPSDDDVNYVDDVTSQPSPTG